MSKKEKIKPYKPLPYRDGNTIIKYYEVEETDHLGFKKLLKCCDFLDKKKKLNEKYVLKVTQLGNKNLMETKEIEEIAFVNADMKLPYIWHDEVVLGFKRVNGSLYFFTVWDYDRGMYWQDFYLKINKESEQEVLEFYKYSSDGLTEEDKKEMELKGINEEDESNKTEFVNLIKTAKEKKWIEETIFIKRTLAGFSGIKGEIAEMKLDHEILHW